jgi:genome maintenance exonuclease 1
MSETPIKSFAHKPWSLPSLRPLNDETGRWYISGKEKYRSVTSYLDDHWDKSFLDGWRKKVGADEAKHIIKTSSERGTSLHSGIETYLTNQGMPNYNDNPLYRMLFLKVKPHLDRIDNIRLMEQPLMSIKHQVAGRPDCIADYDGVQSVLDFKTSGKIKKKKYILTYFLQCGFYGLMAKELYGITFDHNIKQAVIIMATEDNPTAQIFKEKMSICMGMVENFITDPVKFQTRWKKLQKTLNT